MSYKLRVILDVSEDVFRDIYVDENISLEDLHKTITKAFGFSGSEMASFYRSDKDWNQGEEIPLEDFSEDGGMETMRDILVSDIFIDKEDNLIYVYDFIAMWTFFVEVLKLDFDKNEDLPRVSLSVGNVPETAPEKQFKASLEEFDDEFGDDLFTSYDEYDGGVDY